MNKHEAKKFPLCTTQVYHKISLTKLMHLKKKRNKNFISHAYQYYPHAMNRIQDSSLVTVARLRAG